MSTPTIQISYGTTSEYATPHAFVSALLEKHAGDPTDIVVLLDLNAWYANSYVDAIREAFANSPAEVVGVQKEHLFHAPSRTWQCICNDEHATLPMIAFRRSAAPIVLGLLRRGRDIGPALWKIGGLRRKLIPNKGQDGLLRCICFRGFRGDDSAVNRPLKRKDAHLAWLGKHMGKDFAERFVREMDAP